MKRIAIVAFICFTVIACKNDSKQTERIVKEETILNENRNQKTLQIGCYEFNNNSTKIEMEITEIKDSVIGKLNFAYEEKATSYGTFVGTLNKNKLLATYSYTSEGIQTIREISYLVKENQLIEGYGDLDDTGTKFKDIDALNYTSRMPLTKVECDK